VRPPAFSAAVWYPAAMPHTHLDASISIQAPAHAVFTRMGDLSRFNDWNPFASADPTTVSRHEGPAAGPGAVFHYEGKRLGKGRMEIASVQAPHRIDIDMTFWFGDKATRSKSAFLMTQKEGATEVHWTFDEDRGLGMYLMGKLMFDRMMTRTFDAGLQTLKRLVEAEARAEGAQAPGPAHG
jgi:hypothetical protein